MSIRYTVGLALDPVFTARAYRARQLICGQYACWAAEMHLVSLPVTGYFSCPDSSVESLAAGCAEVASKVRETSPRFTLTHRGVRDLPGVIGHIFLDFSNSGRAQPVYALHRSVGELLQQTPGIAQEGLFPGNGYLPHLPLMQYGDLPAAVFADAVEFARAVVTDLEVPGAARAWRLLLLRLRSDAAGESWEGGRWAADLRWQVISSDPL
ncbi:MAG: hypothetical protein AAB528_05995 [Chloroflexota bacterium]